MNKKGIFAGAALLALTGGVLSAPIASATAPPPELHVSPTTVLPGQTLEFKALCYGHYGSVTSPGLTGAVTLNLVSNPYYEGKGKAGDTPGTYTASFPCWGSGGPFGDGTATAEFTIVCTPPVTKPTSPTTTTKPSEPTETTEPPASSQEPTTETTEPTESTAAVAPAAMVRCGSTGTGSGTGKTGSGSSGPQVKVLPKGAPETGDGSEAVY